jgi:hypothetical protein
VRLQDCVMYDCCCVDVPADLKSCDANCSADTTSSRLRDEVGCNWRFRDEVHGAVLRSKVGVIQECGCGCCVSNDIISSCSNIRLSFMVDIFCL